MQQFQAGPHDGLCARALYDYQAGKNVVSCNIGIKQRFFHALAFTGFKGDDKNGGQSWRFSTPPQRPGECLCIEK